MKMLLNLALLGTVALGGFAVTAPAQAASCAAGEHDVASNADAIEEALRERGVAVSGVEEWNGCIRAYVTGPDGSTHMAFYDPNTFQPVAGTAIEG